MSLRFRLALIYSLMAFVLVGLVSGVTTTLLIRALDDQFTARLDERADNLVSAFNNPRLGSQRSLVPTGSLVMIVNRDNRIIYTTSGLGDTFLGSDFALPKSGVLRLADVLDGAPLRVTARDLSQQKGVNQGFVWVALPQGDLDESKSVAVWFLTLGLIVAALLTLLVGWLVGRHELRGLGEAARSAERLDPSASLSRLTLPGRQDEVYRLLEAINRLLARIELQQSREKQLLGQIVHELGAPLTALKAHLQRAEGRTQDPEVAKASLVADELSFTTQDLMQLARGSLELSLAYHLVSARVLQGRLDRLVPGVRFTGDWNTFVLCDPDRLTQALRNLLANARRAAGPEGTVELHLQEPRGEHTPELRFQVRDNGPGLPEGLGERIFDPFVSGSGSSGLGLSVARQIASLHGGRLSGGNRPEGGAEFVLTVPAVSLDEPEEAEEEPASLPART